MTVYLDPTNLGLPVRVVTGLNRSYGIAFDSRGEVNHGVIKFLYLTSEDGGFEHLDHMVTVQNR